MLICEYLTGAPRGAPVRFLGSSNLGGFGAGVESRARNRRSAGCTMAWGWLKKPSVCHDEWPRGKSVRPNKEWDIGRPDTCPALFNKLQGQWHTLPLLAPPPRSPWEVRLLFVNELRSEVGTTFRASAAGSADVHAVHQPLFSLYAIFTRWCAILMTRLTLLCVPGCRLCTGSARNRGVKPMFIHYNAALQWGSM